MRSASRMPGSSSTTRIFWAISVLLANLGPHVGSENGKRETGNEKRSPKAPLFLSPIETFADFRFPFPVRLRLDLDQREERDLCLRTIDVEAQVLSLLRPLDDLAELFGRTGRFSVHLGDDVAFSQLGVGGGRDLPHVSDVETLDLRIDAGHL